MHYRIPERHKEAQSTSRFGTWQHVESVQLDERHEYMRLWRKLTFCIIAFFFVTSLISVFAETREQREVEMAEKSILGSIAVFATPAGHDLCAKVPIACVGANRAELALALIGARETRISGAALLRLLRFRMDGALSEDYECYVLKHSAHSKIYLKQLKPVELERKCRSEVALLEVVPPLVET